MSGKDFIKIMLCIGGYDRNISVSTYRGVDNAIGYKIFAQDKDGIEYCTENCDGLIYNIQALIHNMQERKIYCFIESELLTRYDLSVKDIINDNKRDELIKQLKESEEQK
jgi:hypothetical protein